MGLSFQRLEGSSIRAGEALVLFLFRHFKPILQKDDALADEKALEDGTVPEKLPVLFLGTKAHHVLQHRRGYTSSCRR